MTVYRLLAAGLPLLASTAAYAGAVVLNDPHACLDEDATARPLAQ